MSSPYDLEALLSEEAEVTFAHFDYDVAWRLGQEIRRQAREKDLPVAIEISHHGSPVFFSLAPGGAPDNADWVMRKRKVVERFLHSSLFMRLLCERKGVDFHARYRLSPSDFAASGGGVPINITGVGLVGVATVSGLPDVEDHRLIITAMKAIAAGESAPAPPELEVQGMTPT